MEFGGEVGLGLLGEVLDLGVESMISDERRPRGGGGHEAVPIAVGQALQLLVHRNLLVAPVTLGRPDNGQVGRSGMVRPLEGEVAAVSASRAPICCTPPPFP